MPINPPQKYQVDKRRQAQKPANDGRFCLIPHMPRPTTQHAAPHNAKQTSQLGYNAHGMRLLGSLWMKNGKPAGMPWA